MHKSYPLDPAQPVAIAVVTDHVRFLHKLPDGGELTII